MSAETPGQSAGTFTRLRLRFRDWRGTRPFWAGLFTMLGGFPIAYLPYATLKLGHMSLAMATTAGAGSLIIGVLLVTLGLTMWFQSATRVFAGVAAILLALVSLVVSNIGGFVVGFLLALIGGALALSWVPGKPSSGATGERYDADAPTGQAAPGDAPESPAAGPLFPAAPFDKGEGGETDGVRAAVRDGGHRVG
ncbi:DUF6114 domain-containing protein [Streptomyces griseoloalbus]|uniref:Integral membrane protein n=1 Tax=Streptomyces griseoloalbus TaxID=67303 RepID=A0A7W8BQT8_9ACTN|nr:DUF6114 domain-containing protein [Streptomyces albaduncus]MBB5127897.1 hypothetical protein [Streptomyces albaduncus]GGV83705.1 hypothetical protein GCM10010294_60620 [Streptomyces griseoloalbus]GGW80165.1 hypothetical protein GCM10010340_68100 [Streptomyces albaduncus]